MLCAVSSRIVSSPNSFNIVLNCLRLFFRRVSSSILQYEALTYYVLPIETNRHDVDRRRFKEILEHCYVIFVTSESGCCKALLEDSSNLKLFNNFILNNYHHTTTTTTIILLYDNVNIAFESDIESGYQFVNDGSSIIIVQMLKWQIKMYDMIDNIH